MLLDDHSRIFAKARPTSLYNTVYLPLPCIFTLPQSKSFQFCSLVLKFQFPSPNPFVEARDYECHRFFIVSKRRPLKFSLLESFPCSLRTKKTRSLASPISIWRGMQTLPRHLESLSPSRDAPLPLQLQLRALSPFSRM